MQFRNVTFMLAALAFLVGCQTTQVQSASPERQWAFIDKFSENLPKCYQNIAEEHNLDDATAETWCNCQMAVFAENFSEKEMDYMERITFGGEKLTKVEEGESYAAIARVIPIRKRACGF